MYLSNNIAGQRGRALEQVVMAILHGKDQLSLLTLSPLLPQTSTPAAPTPSTEAPAPGARGHQGKVAGRKRSFSENWLEHKPSSNVNSGDLLQPVIKKKKTVTTPKPKHLKSSANRYCLEHQEDDSEGELNTKLFKVCD